MMVGCSSFRGRTGPAAGGACPAGLESVGPAEPCQAGSGGGVDSRRWRAGTDRKPACRAPLCGPIWGWGLCPITRLSTGSWTRCSLHLRRGGPVPAAGRLLCGRCGVSVHSGHSDVVGISRGGCGRRVVLRFGRGGMCEIKEPSDEYDAGFVPRFRARRISDRQCRMQMYAGSA